MAGGPVQIQGEGGASCQLWASPDPAIPGRWHQGLGPWVTEVWPSTGSSRDIHPPVLSPIWQRDGRR